MMTVKVARYRDVDGLILHMRTIIKFSFLESIDKVSTQTSFGFLGDWEALKINLRHFLHRRRQSFHPFKFPPLYLC
jgi:hypothetical protein